MVRELWQGKSSVPEVGLLPMTGACTAMADASGVIDIFSPLKKKNEKITLVICFRMIGESVYIHTQWAKRLPSRWKTEWIW